MLQPLHLHACLSPSTCPDLALGPLTRPCPCPFPCMWPPHPPLPLHVAPSPAPAQGLVTKLEVANGSVVKVYIRQAGLLGGEDVGMPASSSAGVYRWGGGGSVCVCVCVSAWSVRGV